MRKGALNQAVKEMGCNKVAYAHHKDDIIETMLLSLIFEGRFHSFSPRTYLDRMDLTVIRPLMFVDEVDVIGFMHKYNLPVVKSKCPVDGYTKRQYAKDLIRQLNLDHPGVRERFFHAVLTGNISGWPERVIKTPEERRKEQKKQNKSFEAILLLCLLHSDSFDQISPGTHSSRCVPGVFLHLIRVCDSLLQCSLSDSHNQ